MATNGPNTTVLPVAAQAQRPDGGFQKALTGISGFDAITGGELSTLPSDVLLGKNQSPPESP